MLKLYKLPFMIIKEGIPVSYNEGAPAGIDAQILTLYLEKHRHQNGNPFFQRITIKPEVLEKIEAALRDKSLGTSSKGPTRR